MNRLPATTAAFALLASPSIGQSIFVLDDILFSAYASATERARVGTSVDVIDSDALAELGDIQLSDALASLAGVTFTESGPPGTQSELRIRGADAEYVSVYIDGILVTDPSGTEVSFSNFGGLSTGGIQRIEILRGSNSSLYGGSAVAGVVSITTLPGDDVPEGSSQTVELQAGSYGTVSLDYGLTHRIDDLTLSLGMSHVRSDGFSAADENNGNTEADPYNQSRLTFGAELDVSETLTIGFNGFAEYGEAEFDEGSLAGPVDGTPGDDRSERQTRGLRAYLEAETGIWSHEAALSYYRINRAAGSRTVAPGSFTSPVNSFEADRIALDYTASGQFTETIQLSLGARSMLETATYTNQPGGRGSLRTDGVFAEVLWSPADDFDLTTTLRYDDSADFGSYVTGRTAFAWRPVDGWRLRGAVGSGYRAPSLDELFGVYPGTNFVGNPDLEPEESVSYELGFDYEAESGAAFGLTAFRLEIDNITQFCGPWGAIPPCPPVSAAFAQNTLLNIPGTSVRRGIEAYGVVPVGEIATLSAAYTYTEAESADGSRLPQIPRHDLAVAVDADLNDRTRLHLAGQLIADRENGSFDVEPYEDYAVFDATVSYDLSEDVEAFIRVDNLFDEEYQTTSGFGTSDRAFYLGLRASF